MRLLRRYWLEQAVTPSSDPHEEFGPGAQGSVGVARWQPQRRSAPGGWLRLLGVSLALATLVTRPSHAATEQAVLFINVNGSYNTDALNVFNTLTNAGARGTWVNLDKNAKASQVLATNSFDQIWIFDLSFGNDPYTNDWQSLAAWYNARPNLPIICDGRMLSSYWRSRWSTQGQALSANYYENLKARGGGLMLATDHSYGSPDIGSYALGINSVNAQIGLNPFTNQFSLASIPVDTNCPLMNTPNNLGSSLWDDSTPSRAPFGLQPNGKMLYTVAWHSGNQYTPGISTTIEKAGGYRVRIMSPLAGATVLSEQAITFSAAQSNGVAPFTYSWTSDKVGLLGTGSNLVHAGLSPGTHAITVTGVDGFNQIDTASVWLTVWDGKVYIDNTDPAVAIWWSSATGVTFQVQWTPEAEPTTWYNLGSPVAGNGTTNLIFDSTRDRTQKFYRVLTQ